MGKVSSLSAFVLGSTAATSGRLDNAVGDWFVELDDIYGADSGIQGIKYFNVSVPA
jgi:hypothetical protein